MEKQQRNIAFFFFAIFGLLFSHQLAPHFHHIEENEENSCYSLCHINSTEKTVSFSNFFNHLLNYHCHLEVEHHKVFKHKLKTHFFSFLVYQSNQLISKKVLNWNEINCFASDSTLQKKCFYLKSFQRRGPPYFV